MLVKRKVFHGKACEVAKQLIDDLLNEQCQVSVMSFQEMVDSKDSKAYLCHHCYSKAKKCADLIDEVRLVAGDLLNMASKLTTLPLPAVQSRRKRPASNRDDPVVHSTGSNEQQQSESLGKLVTPVSLNGVKMFYTAGTPSRVQPTHASSSTHQADKSPAVSVSYMICEI